MSVTAEAPAAEGKLQGVTSVTVLQGKLEIKTQRILAKAPLNKFVAETASTAQKSRIYKTSCRFFFIIQILLSLQFTSCTVILCVGVCERCVCVCALLCEISIVFKVLVGCLCFQYICRIHHVEKNCTEEVHGSLLSVEFAPSFTITLIRTA
jgi:hypothetical protein